MLTTFEGARERANPQSSRRTQPPSHSSALLTGSTGSRTEPQCSYCQQSHPSSACPSVTTLEDRKRSLKISGRCFNCLRRGHVAHACKSSSRCQRCKRKHRTSICDDHHSHSQDETQLSTMSRETSLNPATPPSSQQKVNLRKLFVRIAVKPTQLCSHSSQQKVNLRKLFVRITIKPCFYRPPALSFTAHLNHTSL